MDSASVTPQGPSAPLPPPKDMWHHLSHTTRSRPASDVKRFYRFFQIPGIGQIAGGLPAAEYFPFDDLSANVALPDRFKPTPTRPVEPPATSSAGKGTGKGRDRLDAKTASSLPSAHVVVPKDSKTSDPLRRIDITSALQYGQAEGYPPLFRWIKEFTTKHLHPTIPYAGGPNICFTVGNTDGFNKTLQAFNDEWREGKDPIEDKPALLCEQFAYMNAIQAAAPRGMNIAPVKVDAQGMVPYGKDGLDDVLEHWDYSKGRRPHMMYTVTMGQNPTSSVMGIDRRKEIYELCQKYDVLIVEDEPYWYLQYPSATDDEAAASSTAASSSSASDNLHTRETSGFPFLDSLSPSYLSVDVDGRVIRLDTFSKTVAPGCRLGWITAQPALVERILRIAEMSTQQPSGFVQSMIAELVMGPQSKDDKGVGGGKNGQGWDFTGWVRWLEGLRGNYERRMQAMSRILEEGSVLLTDAEADTAAPSAPFSTLAIRKDGRASIDDDREWISLRKQTILSFNRPMGGMFLWLRMHYETHPLADKFPGPKLANALFAFLAMKPYLVIVTPGIIFSPTAEVRDKDGWKYFRLCFAACKEDDLEDIVHRMVAGLHAYWHITDPKRIQELLDELDRENVMLEGEQNQEYPGTGVGNLAGYC